MTKAEERGRKWDEIRLKYKTGSLTTKELADEYGYSRRTIFNIINRPVGSKPIWYRSGRRENHKTKQFVCRWRDDNPSGSAAECAKAAKKILRVSVSTTSIYGMWGDCSGHDIGHAVRKNTLSYATLDELAALCGTSDKELADRAYDVLRKEMNPYLSGIFAVIHDKQVFPPPQARRFARIVGRVIPKGYDLRADACQQVEIIFWRLCKNYKITKGSNFFTYVNMWLPYKFKEAFRATMRHYDRTICMEEWRIESQLQGDGCGESPDHEKTC